MIAYKGFNKDLACTLGQGVYQYEIGKTYEEPEANCAKNGFHCVEEPIRVLDWYRDGRYCLVKAEDIHEDGTDKIACKKMTILKELTINQLMAHEAAWMLKHPERTYSKLVKKERGTAQKGGTVIVRGKNPMAKGELGTTIFLVQEGKGTKNILKISVLPIDGKVNKPGTWYDVEGRAHEKIRAKEA